MMLNPLEEQIRLLAFAILVGNRLRFQSEVVTQKIQAIAHVVLDQHPANLRWAAFSLKMTQQHTGLIEYHSSGRSDHRMGITPLEFGVAFCPHNKECFDLVNHEQSCKIQIAPIHQVESPWQQN
jgi:hypothetical protein